LEEIDFLSKTSNKNNMKIHKFTIIISRKCVLNRIQQSRLTKCYLMQDQDWLACSPFNLHRWDDINRFEPGPSPIN